MPSGPEALRFFGPSAGGKSWALERWIFTPESKGIVNYRVRTKEQWKSIARTLLSLKFSPVECPSWLEDLSRDFNAAR